MVFFKPRKPLQYMEPEKPSRRSNYSGSSVFLQHIKDNNIVIPTPETQKSKYQVLAERRAMLDELEASQIALDRQSWNPNTNPPLPSESTDGRQILTKTEDPSKTVFVGRLPYSFTREDLITEFSASGSIVNAYVVRDKMTGKSKGYGFVEFEHEDSCRRAMVQNNAVLGNRKIVIDFERGRTQENWFPRRLGGGLGVTRATRTAASRSIQNKNKLNSRNDSSSGSNRDSRHYRDRDRDYDRHRDRGRDYGRDRGRDSNRNSRYSRSDRYETSSRKGDYRGNSDRDYSKHSGRDRDYYGRN